MEGSWRIEIANGQKITDGHSLILMFSDTSKTYWGYSDFRSQVDAATSQWLVVNDFNPSEHFLSVDAYTGDKVTQYRWGTIRQERDGRVFTGDSKDGGSFRLTHPN
jgi:hypothetical protein